MSKYDERIILTGWIGLGLSAALWLLASWRLIFHTLVRRRQQRQRQQQQQRRPNFAGGGGGEQTSQRLSLSPRRRSSLFQSSQSTTLFWTTPWFPRRRTFHSLLWMAMSCEALAYADLSGLLVFSKDPIFADKLAYVLLDVAGRSILELLAFCTVTAIWLKTAIESSPSVLWGSHQNSPFGILPALFLVMILFLVLASATLSVIALVLYQDDTLETIQELPWSRAQTILEATAWGVHALVVIECLIVTSKRVLNLIPTSQWTKRLSLLGKTVLPMLVASLAYATRCLWLLAILFGRHHEILARGTWAWWIGFEWLPTWLAVGVLLYSARKRDPQLLPSLVLGGAGEVLHEPLLFPSARPPAEAFMAFSRHRRQAAGGDESGVDDSFTFCRSPITRVAVAQPDDWDEDDGDNANDDAEEVVEEEEAQPTAANGEETSAAAASDAAVATS